LLLGGKCRTCAQPISLLYPFIEILTTIVLSLLYLYIPLNYFFAYFIFFSALIVTIRSDIETMFISRFTTLYLVPLGLIFSAYNILPLSLSSSITGAFFGYLFLFIINAVFKKLRKQDGIGEGDFDLLLFIGSFTGVIGCWVSITIGSIIGSLYGLYTIFYCQHYHDNSQSLRHVKIPFGPFLALGALLFVFFQRHFQIFLA
jgi:leader peptidase (prepilin peptidase)/N-methyltransferase